MQTCRGSNGSSRRRRAKQRTVQTGDSGGPWDLDDGQKRQGVSGSTGEDETRETRRRVRGLERHENDSSRSRARAAWQQEFCLCLDSSLEPGGGGGRRRGCRVMDRRFGSTDCASLCLRCARFPSPVCATRICSIGDSIAQCNREIGGCTISASLFRPGHP
jgi:hypothetical protein